MTTDNFDHIKDLGNSLEVTPPSGTWNKLENKLLEKGKIAKKRKYNLIRFWLSIAASTMVIFTCATVIYFEVNEQQVQVPGSISDWEELSITNDYFYSVESVHMTHKIEYP